MSVRLIAGEKGGLHLVVPRGRDTRPTLGRVRESLFMILHERLAGARVLDLFAGAGLLGLEALSRGAVHATFVESARPALAALRENLGRTGWTARAELVTRDAFGWLRAARPTEPFDLILLDPPYHHDHADRTLRILGERATELIAPAALVVAQVGRRDPLEDAYTPLHIVDRRHYAETTIAFYSLQ